MSPNPTFTLPDEFAEPLARVADRLGVLASRVVWYDSISSTNTVAASLAESGADEGTLVVADAQSAGRGRLGRVWASPPGAGLYLSLILRPPAHAVALITIAAGLAVAEGIQAATGYRASVKWPNDICAGTRKVAGILAEAGSFAERIRHVIVGVGINIGSAAYPPDVARRATSLEAELGRPVERGLVLAECLAATAARYDELRQRRGHLVLQGWRDRAVETFGRRVEWDGEGTSRTGIVEDVDESGGLLVRTGEGVSRVIAGEIRWS